MESNQQDHAHHDSNSKSSSCKEDSDHIRSENDYMGAARSYECVFCKRGFTTAQALGGHMNIHRKDRAKNSSRSSSMIIPSGSGSAKVDDDDNDDGDDQSSGLGLFPNGIHGCPSHLQHYPHVNSFQTLFPAPPWQPPHTLNSSDVYVPITQFQLKPFEDDRVDYWRGGLRLGVGSSPGVDGRGDEREKRGRGCEEDDDELDLELRLGHDHR